MENEPRKATTLPKLALLAFSGMSCRRGSISYINHICPSFYIPEPRT